MLAAAKTTGGAAVSDAAAGAVSPAHADRAKAMAPIAKPNIREPSPRRVVSIRPARLALVVNSMPLPSNGKRPLSPAFRCDIKDFLLSLALKIAAAKLLYHVIYISHIRSAPLPLEGDVRRGQIRTEHEPDEAASLERRGRPTCRSENS